MFFAVIAAYVLSVAFAFCGLVSAFTYIQGVDRSAMDYPTFLSGLAVALWPLAVAMVLVLLTQIACLIERWMLLWQMAEGGAPAPAARKPAAAEGVKKAAAKDKPAPSYFPCDTPAPAPAPAPAVKAAAEPQAEAAPKAAEAPAPVQQPPVQAPAEEAPAATPSPSSSEAAAPAIPAQPAPKKEGEGLSFFKLD